MFPPTTILELFSRRVVDDATRPALIVDRGRGYESLDWRTLGEDAARAAAALASLSVLPGDRVAVLSENRYEWLLADLALQILGAVSVPLHTTLTAAQADKHMRDCDPAFAIVSSALQLEKLQPGSWANLRAVIVLDKLVSSSAQPASVQRSPLPLHSWVDLLNTQPTVDLRLLDAAASQLAPGQVATILYTSGTSGDPRGVSLTHGNLAFNAVATLTAFNNPRSERRFGLLPWSHIFARTCDLYAWIASGTQLVVGRSRESAIEDMQATQPTYLNGVPYFFEKLQRGVSTAGGDVEPGAVRQLLGGAMRVCCSGGAPLSDELFDFFQQQRLPVLEGYGMTEASPVIATCTERDFRRGSVGRTLPGVEVRIADDGEVLTRGPHVMAGYHHNAAATAEALREGWLHTGDLGRIDADDFLYLSGRKKELLVLSTGRKVSPSPLEALLTRDPLIAQAMIVGDGQKQLGALLVVDQAVVNRLLASAGGHSEARKVRGTSNARLHEVVAERIASRLGDMAAHEQVRRFTILEQPFSAEMGELTGKQSLRRAAIEARYAATIAALFRD